MSQAFCWQLVEPGEALQRTDKSPRDPDDGEVLIEVAGCGVCHTDLGFLDGHVRPRTDFPLVLGHEITGKVLSAGAGASDWVGKTVLVPAVIPCGDCAFCNAGRGNACAKQMMPGNDCDGGFASHVTLRAHGLTEVGSLPAGYELADLSVVADAVTTPLQAVRRAGVSEGDFVVVVGAGGVGTYAVQIAAASGAHVVAIDVDDSRLELLPQHGAKAVINSKGLSARDVKAAVRDHAKEAGIPRFGWKIFECSGHPAGQEAAYGLLVSAATLAIVGFTREAVNIRLSNLMAFDADAFGSWGCPPELYAEAVDLVLTEKVKLLPFTRRVPMDDIAEVINQAREGKDPRRAILIP